MTRSGHTRHRALMGLLILLWVALPVASAGPLTGTPEIVSLAHHGDLPNRTVHSAAVDDAARFVAFSSFATDILPDQPAGCQASDRETCILLYVVDLDGEGTPRMVTNADGVPPDDSVSHVAISGDGSTVLFESRASNLVPGDTNGERDVFAYDIETGEVELISVCTDGVTACGGGDYSIGVSHDGRFVSFSSKSPGLAPGDEDDAADVFVRDRVTSTTDRVSLGPEGQETAAYVEQRYGRGISDDGRYVIFGTTERGWSDATDTGCKEATGSHSTGPCRHLYVFDREAGTSRVLGLGPDGHRAHEGPFIGWLSGDGAAVAYQSKAPILNPDDPERQAYIETTATGEVRMISTNAAGEPANAHVWLRTVTPDMRYAMLQTAATNLVDDEVVEGEHVYVKDLEAGTVWRLAEPNLAHMDFWIMDIAPDLSWVSFMAHPSDQEQHHVMTQKVFGIMRDVHETAPAGDAVVGPEPAPLDMPMMTPATGPKDPAGPASSGEQEAVEAPWPGVVALLVLALTLALVARTRKG